MNPRPKDMDEYVAAFPKHVQRILQDVRTTIRKAAPGSKETIKYQIPTFTLNGNLISFAAWTNHLALYPGAGGVARFARELSAYECSKGTVRFPLDQPIPRDLIRRIVKFRVEMDSHRAAAGRRARATKSRAKAPLRTR